MEHTIPNDISLDGPRLNIIAAALDDIHVGEVDGSQLASRVMAVEVKSRHFPDCTYVVAVHLSGETERRISVSVFAYKLRECAGRCGGNGIVGGNQHGAACCLADGVCGIGRELEIGHLVESGHCQNDSAGGCLAEAGSYIDGLARIDVAYVAPCLDDVLSSVVLDDKRGDDTGGTFGERGEWGYSRDDVGQGGKLHVVAGNLHPSVVPPQAIRVGNTRFQVSKPILHPTAVGGERRRPQDCAAVVCPPFET